MTHVLVSLYPKGKARGRDISSLIHGSKTMVYHSAFSSLAKVVAMAMWYTFEYTINTFRCNMNINDSSNINFVVLSLVVAIWSVVSEIHFL